LSKTTTTEPSKKPAARKRAANSKSAARKRAANGKPRKPDTEALTLVSEETLPPLGDWYEAEHGQLAPAARRLLSPLPLGMIALLIALIGFIGGVLVQKGQGGSSSSGPVGLLASLRSGAGGSNPFGGGSGGPTIGTVSNVNGKTLYVSDPQGNTFKVMIGTGATVTRSAKSTASQIHPGDSVIIQGARNPNGTINAQSVSASAQGTRPAGLFGGGGPPSSLGSGGSTSGSGGSASGSSGSGSSGSGSGAVNRLFGQ
jgi:uncharacterized protein DUF5666